MPALILLAGRRIVRVHRIPACRQERASNSFPVVTNLLPSQSMVELRGYIDEKGNRPFANWLEDLDATAAAKVSIALARMEQGNFSNVRSLGRCLREQD